MKKHYTLRELKALAELMKKAGEIRGYFKHQRDLVVIHKNGRWEQWHAAGRANT
jgi:hypothetical protein